MPSELTDRRALNLHRARARRQDASARFLHSEAADLLSERLAEVNRRFTAAALVAPFAAPFKKAAGAATHVADGDILDLEESAHDLIVHAMALHWANDPVGQIIQCRRALAPDGLFLAVAFGGRTLHELRTSLTEAEALICGGVSPRVAPMADIRDLGALLQRAGLALPVADRDVLTASYGSLRSLVGDLRAMGETNALADRLRRPARKDLFATAEKIYRERFPADGGRITATFELVFLAGWAPAENQPQPLRPGSASSRLADALGTFELPAGDPVRSKDD